MSSRRGFSLRRINSSEANMPEAQMAGCVQPPGQKPRMRARLEYSAGIAGVALSTQSSSVSNQKAMSFLKSPFRKR